MLVRTAGVSCRVADPRVPWISEWSLCSQSWPETPKAQILSPPLIPHCPLRLKTSNWPQTKSTGHLKSTCQVSVHQRQPIHGHQLCA
jgi:hypothetical protein